MIEGSAFVETGAKAPPQLNLILQDGNGRHIDSKGQILFDGKGRGWQKRKQIVAPGKAVKYLTINLVTTTPSVWKDIHVYQEDNP